MKDRLRETIDVYYRCLEEWNASYEDYARRVGLSYTSLTLLRAIAEKESVTQKTLSEECLLPKQTVNSVITSFWKMGWVSLAEDPKDRRNKIIELTKEGKAIAQQVLTPVLEVERQAMKSLTVAERKQLLAASRKYVDACLAGMQSIGKEEA